MARVIYDFPGVPRQLFLRPRRIIQARTVADVPAALRAVEAETDRGAWAAGFLAYEAAPAFDRALRTRPPAGPVPLLWFAVCDAPEPGPARAVPAAAAPGRTGTLWSPSSGRDRYDAAIHEILRRIAAGDVYQVNHTLRFTADTGLPPETLYEELVRGRHGRYHALIQCDDWAVISASPELFFDVTRDRIITTRPMKGTIRRGRWLQEDRAAAATLAASAKDRAENLMIVDLLRNDLGRIARFGSVHVPRLFDVETYPTVHQLTSTVTARLRDDVTLCDIFAATFPCGSVTGAPKVTAMRAIAELEDSPRGVYCGAVGLVRGDGSATFNVAIRTIVVADDGGAPATDGDDDAPNVRRATYGAGGGITWDSRADAEYDEAVAKAALLTESTPAFHLVETMRLEHGTIGRLERHLARLRASAAYWAFADGSADRAAALLAQTAAALPAGSHRVRLTAAPDGTAHVTVSPLCERFGELPSLHAGSRTAGPDMPAVAIARTAVSARNRLLHHKTTARDVYDTRRADFPDAFDVLLYNDEGRVTEFTFGNVVAWVGGRLVTPPRQDGLLPGTYREELLDAGVITEAPLSLADLRSAPRVYHVNSVRGATRVRLEGSGGGA